MRISCVKIIIGAIFLLSVFINPENVYADIAWSDNFNDGTYDMWTIKTGTWTAEDNYLTTTDKGGIHHPSTNTIGTWSFDAYIAPVPSDDFSFLFMLEQPMQLPVTASTEFTAYFISIYSCQDGSPSTINLRRISGSVSETLKNLVVYEVGRDISHRWIHIDITRDADGRIKVYLNKDLIIEYVDTLIQSSNYFMFLGESGPAIDNLVVKNIVETPQKNAWSRGFGDTMIGNLNVSNPSSIAYGTWRIDMYSRTVYNQFIYLNGTWEPSGYYYWLESTPSAFDETIFKLGKYNGTEIEDSYILDEQAIYGILTNQRNQIDITRDVQGRFYVYFNGEQILSAHDNQFKTSNEFRIHTLPNANPLNLIEAMDVVNISLPHNFVVHVEIFDDVVTQGDDVSVAVQAVDDYGVVIPYLTLDVSVDGNPVNVRAFSGGLYKAVIDTSQLVGNVEIMVDVEKSGLVDSWTLHNVQVIAPASFTVSHLTITPESVIVGDTVRIGVQIDNIGGQSGSFNVELKIDDELVDEHTVLLDPNKSETVIFDYKPDQQGTYSVDISGLLDIFTVVSQETEETDTEEYGFIPGFPLMSILAALAIYYLIRKWMM